jgi:hypothetical protein
MLPRPPATHRTGRAWERFALFRGCDPDETMARPVLFFAATPRTFAPASATAFPAAARVPEQLLEIPAFVRPTPAAVSPLVPNANVAAPATLRLVALRAASATAVAWPPASPRTDPARELLAAQTMFAATLSRLDPLRAVAPLSLGFAPPETRPCPARAPAATRTT